MTKPEQHTPGPWVVSMGDAETECRVYCGYKTKRKNKNHVTGGAYSADVRMCIASVHSATTAHYYPDRSEAKANARLIAAAPDLLAALKACANVLAGHESTKSGLVRALEMARDVMAKVEQSK